MARLFPASILALVCMPFFVQASPGGLTFFQFDQADDPRQLIERIKLNQERVRKLLAGNDSGEATRQIQKQIADDLAQLLQQPDDSSTASAPKKNAPLANDQSSKAADKTPNVPTLEKKLIGATGVQSRPSAEPSAEPPPKNTPEGWGPTLPPRVRQEVESYPRERLVPGYEELLRAYYRTIAASGPRKEGD